MSACRDCGVALYPKQFSPMCRPCAIKFYRAKAESGDLLIVSAPGDALQRVDDYDKADQ